MDPGKKVALVTGANKSIGLSTVRALARLGMTTYLSSRDREGGEAAAAAAQADGDVRYVHLDVTDEATISAALEVIAREAGRLDVLVNNAGIAVGGWATDASPSEIQRALDTNTLGPIRIIQLALPLLRKSTAARVVNVSSTAGLFSFMTDPERPKPLPYCMSKAALNAATAMFADALRSDGIKVNAACPGFVYSAVSHFQGTRTPDEGAEVIVELATLPDDGPTGEFFNWIGPQQW